MEILAKFGSALHGFWWSLDDHERRMLIVGVAWTIAVVAGSRVEKAQREQERREIVQQVVEELRG